MRPIIVVVVAYGITCILAVIATCFAMFAFPDIGERSLGVFWGGIVWLSIILSLETIVFTFLYYKRLRKLFLVFIPGYIIVTFLAYTIIKEQVDNMPIKIPPPGKLFVAEDVYKMDTLLVLNSLKDQLSKTNYINECRDTVIQVRVDTLIYKNDLKRFFAIAICIIKRDDTLSYLVDYRVGFDSLNVWKLNRPKGNIWTAYFRSIPELKYKIRQYYYKRYSINNSSSKPEIWDDESIFNKE